MKILKELRAKNPADIEKQLSESRKELIKLNTQVATGTALKSPGQVRKVKKNIARMITILKEKQQNG